MNPKILHRIEIVVATTFLLSMGLTGILGAQKLSEKAIGLSVASQVLSAQTPVPNSQLQATLNQMVTAEKIPGASVYISTPGGKWSGAGGVSSLESKTQIHPDDRFAIASISKTFAAVVILQLVAEGKINLDRQIANYLPKNVGDRIANSDTITVRQLLNHTSGVAEYLNTEAFIQATAKRSRSQPWTASEAIKYIYDREAANEPGDQHVYTDTNYILVELIVEQTTGGTLAQAIRDRILTPLGMQSTYTELREPGNGILVTGYGKRSADKIESFADINDGNGLGDGGLVSTGEDLAKFTQALFVKKSLLSPAMMKEMLTYVDSGNGNKYGLGVEQFATPYGTALGHSGKAYGIGSLMLYLPSQDTTVVVMMNNQERDPERLAFKELEVTLDR